MLSINTNLSSLIAQNSLNKSTQSLNQAIERMTTGFRINHASDNAANYSISNNLTTKISSYMVAEDNVSMGLDMIDTANGSLEQISDKLTRLRSLATQASNGTYGGQSLNAINSEANALVDEINRLYSTAEYNGIKLFGGAQQSEPTPATYAMARTGSNPNVTYSNEDIEAMLASGDMVILDNSVNSFEDGKSYLITDKVGLQRIATLVNDGTDDGSGSEFVLGADIDLEGIEWEAIGYCDDDSGDDYYFCGTFDGNGHTISHLTTTDTNKQYQGLFGQTDSATIKNVALVDVDIKGDYNVGGLVGYAAYSTTITNCYATGSVSCTGD